MGSQRKFIVVGNWKMNVLKTDIDRMTKIISTAPSDLDLEAVVGCPSCYLSYARQQLPKNIGVAAQNCYKVAKGNFSGEISAEMIQDCGCDWVILGHPERRTIFSETDEFIGDKVKHAQESGLKIIACLCETKEDRDKNNTKNILNKQLLSLSKNITDWSNIVIAFEALWASNTGIFATNEQIQETLQYIRQWLRQNINYNVANNTRIIYAGSVNANNCQEMARLPDLDGFLVGSAALKTDIVDIMRSSRMSCSRLWAGQQQLVATSQLITNIKNSRFTQLSLPNTRRAIRYI